MADNLDLAIRIRADFQLVLSNLKKLKQGVGGTDREMRRAARSADTWSRTVSRGLSPRMRGSR